MRVGTSVALIMMFRCLFVDDFISPWVTFTSIYNNTLFIYAACNMSLKIESILTSGVRCVGMVIALKQEKNLKQRSEEKNTFLF